MVLVSCLEVKGMGDQSLSRELCSSRRDGLCEQPGNDMTSYTQEVEGGCLLVLWFNVESKRKKEESSSRYLGRRVFEPKGFCSTVRQDSKVGTEWSSGPGVGRKEVGDETLARNGRSPSQDPGVELNPETPDPGTDHLLGFSANVMGGGLDMLKIMIYARQQSSQDECRPRL